jgi:hypothetical protein
MRGAANRVFRFVRNDLSGYMMKSDGIERKGVQANA